MWSKALLAAAVALLAAPTARAATDVEPTQPAAQQAVTIEGTIGRVTGDRLWLQDPQGSYYPVRITPQAQIEANGRKVGLQQLPFGTPVRATATVVNGEQVAQTIDVQPTRPAPQLPRAPAPTP